MLEALCDEQGNDTGGLSEHDRKTQLAAAKRLLAGGLDPPGVRRMVRWLSVQSWVTSGIDLPLLEKQHAKWVIEGKPEVPKSRGSPNGRASPTDFGARLRNNTDEARRLLGLPPPDPTGDVIEAKGRVTR